MGKNAADRSDRPDARGAETDHLRDPQPIDDQQSDDEAVAAERTGRTNTARDMTAAPRPAAPGRWDTIGEPGEGLDELQGLYASDAPAQEQLPESGAEPPTLGANRAAGPTITPALWDQLRPLEGTTLETPRGEPFRVMAVTPGAQVTVSPLDGGQEWHVQAEEIEAAWRAVEQGLELDGLASIRLQEAGVASPHPEYIAGLLQAITRGGT